MSEEYCPDCGRFLQAVYNFECNCGYKGENREREIRMNISNLNPANIALFKSRKFWLAIIGIAVDIAIALIPELEAVRAELILVWSAMIMIAINGYAQEDKVLAEKTGQRNPKYTNM